MDTFRTGGAPHSVRFAGFVGAIQVLSKSPHLRWLAFVLCLIAFGSGTFAGALRDANRYAGISFADWLPTNVWLKSTECARQRHVWLAICNDDKLVPISDEAFGDDPGHALLLDVWAIATDNMVSLVDVARLNIWINIVGLIVLASFLFAVRAYVTSTVLLAAGPVIFVGWIGLSPHWSLIGITSMTMVLPMAILAKECRVLSRWSGNAYIGLGLLCLSLAALVREAIGDMGLVVTLGVIAAVAVRRRRSGGRWQGSFVLASVILVATATPTLVIATRDASFTLEPAHRVARHGFADILYKGLGAVPNSFGISYDDSVATAAAERAEPGVITCSPEFYKILWKLYLDNVMSRPAEVARIYFEKAKLILADHIVCYAPPLGIVLIIVVVHFFAMTASRIWRQADFFPLLLAEGAALVVIGLFVVQAILAYPSRFFAMPVGVSLVMLLGVFLEFFGRSALYLLASKCPRRLPFVLGTSPDSSSAPIRSQTQRTAA